MLIKCIYIKNFKAFKDETIIFQKDNLIIGENDSGKSTILEALDIFFNQEKIEKTLVIDPNTDAQIGIGVEQDGRRFFIKKVYKAKTFKLDSTIGDSSILDGYQYVFLPSNNMDVVKLIQGLAVAKAIDNISSELRNDLLNVYNDSMNEILNTIDGELLVVNSDGTSFSSSSTLKLDSAIKYDITSSGIPLEGRGSGFKKTVIYSLLTKGVYENVIIGIDEIENSLSINNARDLINVVKNRFSQSFITTHSTAIMRNINSDTVLPIIKGECQTIAELIESLGGIEDKEFVLVEGKTDMLWLKAIFDLLNLNNKYIVIQCGGHSNIQPVYDELVRKCYVAHRIKDGDSGDTTCSLSKECIELYIPLANYNSLFGLSEVALPSTKNAFFETIINHNSDLSKDTCKDIIADNVASFLDLTNPLIQEIKNLLGI